MSDFHKCQDMGWKFEFAGDMNAGKRNGTRAKLTGLKAGEPDIRIYLPGGVLKMIEMKTSKGKLSPDQIKRHELLYKIGFDVQVVKAATCDEAVEKCNNLLYGWLFLQGDTVQ